MHQHCKWIVFCFALFYVLFCWKCHAFAVLSDFRALSCLLFSRIHLNPCENEHEHPSGYLGASSCMILSAWGSAWGTWRAGLGVCNMGIDHPKGVIKNVVPIVMAGVLGIYGLIVSVIITQAISSPGQDFTNTYSLYNGYTHVSFCLFIDVNFISYSVLPSSMKQ